MTTIKTDFTVRIKFIEAIKQLRVKGAAELQEEIYKLQFSSRHWFSDSWWVK